MPDRGVSLVVNAVDVSEIEFPIPGATPGGVAAKLINVDAARGLVTTIIHIKLGAQIPATTTTTGRKHTTCLRAISLTLVWFMPRAVS